MQTVASHHRRLHSSDSRRHHAAPHFTSDGRSNNCASHLGSNVSHYIGPSDAGPDTLSYIRAFSRSILRTSSWLSS